MVNKNYIKISMYLYIILVKLEFISVFSCSAKSLIVASLISTLGEILGTDLFKVKLGGNFEISNVNIQLKVKYSI